MKQSTLPNIIRFIPEGETTKDQPENIMNETKQFKTSSTIQKTKERTLFRRKIWKKFIDKVMTPFIRLLYRSGLQRLTGRVMVVLTHVGRKTGKIRKTVLYVQLFNPQTREVMLVSAFGVTDWFLNVRANPALLVEVGQTSYLPDQRILTMEEIANLEKKFRQEHPIIARIQAWLMGALALLARRVSGLCQLTARSRILAKNMTPGKQLICRCWNSGRPRKLEKYSEVQSHQLINLRPGLIYHLGAVRLLRSL